MSGSRNANAYQFRISTEGFQEFYRDMTELANSSGLGNRALETLVRSSPQLAQAFLTASEATDKAARAQRELSAAQERAAAVVERSGAPVRGLSDQLGALESRTLAARRGVGDLRGAMELLGAGGASGALGVVGGAIGNFADLLGTAATAAGTLEGRTGLLTGRLTTLAGLVGLPVLLQQVGLGINAAGEAANTAAGGADRYRAALEELAPTLDGIASRARTAAEELARTNLRRLELETGRALETRGTLLGQLPDLGRREQALAGRVAQFDRQRDGASPLMLRALDRQSAEARAELEEVRAERARIEAERAQLDESLRLYDQTRQQILAPVQLGPNLPAPTPDPVTRGARAGGGAGRRATATPDPILYESGPGTVFPLVGVQDALGRASDLQAQREDRARQERERAEREHLARIERENERSTDAVVQYAGDAFADLLSANSRGWQGMLDTFRSTATRTFARIAAEAVLRPIISPIVAGVNGLFSADGGAGGGGIGFGSITSFLGLGNSLNGLTGGSISNALGLGNLGGGVSGLLNSQIYGSGVAGLSSTTGPGGLAALEATGFGAAGGPAAGGLTFGQALGGVGGGFAAGSLVSSLVATSAARQTNGNIGAGVGAVAGTIIGGPIGGIIGGSAGGLLGSLFGPGDAFSGGDVKIGSDAAGNLVFARTTGKNFDEGALKNQVLPLIDQANADFRSLGLRFNTGVDAFVGGGESGNPRTVVEALERFGNVGRITSDDPRIRGALSRATTVQEAIANAQFVQQFDALTTAGDPVAEFDRALKQLTDSFAEARKEAERLGLDTTKLTEAQARQTAELERARDANNGRAAANALLEQLTFGQGSVLAPEQRGFAALSAINTARRGVDGTQGLDEFSRVFASAFPVVQDVFGVSSRTNAVLQDAASVLGVGDTTGLARLLESQTSGTTQLSDTFAAYGGATVSALETLRTDLIAEISRLRAEMSGYIRRIA